MSSIDITSLLDPIEQEPPCGPNRAYEAPFLELETLARGTPERRMGDEVIPGEEPDWNAVRERSIELLGQTKDLRVMIHLAVALVETHGLQGLRDGLTLLHESLERYWDHLHPQLDPDDDNDPLERMNIVASLGDRELFGVRVQRIPLTDSPRLGRLSLRDIAIASGEVTIPSGESEGEGGPTLDMALVDGAFEDTQVDDLKEFMATAEDAQGQLLGLDRFLIEKVGADRAPQLDELKQVLVNMLSQFREHLERRGVITQGAESTEDAPEAGGESFAQTGEIRSREDVIRVLEGIFRYYEVKEPSSPIPLLVRRAQRLVAKSYVEIVRDLTPGAISEVETIGGEDYSSPE